MSKYDELREKIRKLSINEPKNIRDPFLAMLDQVTDADMRRIEETEFIGETRSAELSTFDPEFAPRVLMTLEIFLCGASKHLRYRGIFPRKD